MAQALSLKSFGIPADGSDQTKAINYAATVAKAQGQDLEVPEGGEFGHANVLLLDSVRMKAAGPTSTLRALNPKLSAIKLTGSMAGVIGLRLVGKSLLPADRTATLESSRVLVDGALAFLVKGLTISSCAGASIFVKTSSQGVIRRNHIMDSIADSIHITARSSNIEIHGNVGERSGDDFIAVVSYQKDGGMCSDILAHHNIGSGNKGGRVMSIVGGQRVRYIDNTLLANKYAAGIYLAQENYYKTFGVHDSEVEHNTVVMCGTVPPMDHSGIMCYSDGFEPNSNVAIRRNAIYCLTGVAGIRGWGPSSGVMVVDQNYVESTNPVSVPSAWMVTPYGSGQVGVRS